MKKLLYFSCLFILICMDSDIKAQPPDPGGGGNNEPGCFPPPCIPIDGGLSWLLVTGIAYGGKKVYEMNKSEDEDLEA